MTTKELRELTAYAKSPRGPYEQRGEKLPVGPWLAFPKGMPARKERRWRDARARRTPRSWHYGTGRTALGGKKFRFLHVNWHERLLKEMKNHPPAEKAVLSGKLDNRLRPE